MTSLSNKRAKTRRVALCGVSAALAIVILYLGGLTALDLSVLVLTSLLTMLMAVEAGVKMAWIYSAVTSVIALFLLPSKLYAVMYVLFSAVYPLLKLYIERIPTLPAFIVKLSVLDTMLVVSLILAEFVFAAGDDFYALNFITILAGTLLFVLYDICLTSLITFYMVKLRKRLGLKKHF